MLFLSQDNNVILLPGEGVGREGEKERRREEGVVECVYV